MRCWTSEVFVHVALVPQAANFRKDDERLAALVARVRQQQVDIQEGIAGKRQGGNSAATGGAAANLKRLQAEA